MKTTIQISLDKSVKVSAARMAEEFGFDTLQDAVKLFVKQLARKAVSVRVFSVEDEVLSRDQEEVLTKKYLEVKQARDEGEANKASTAEELIEQLNK